MHDLSSKVLTKIQNLLTSIDSPQKQKHSTMKKQHNKGNVAVFEARERTKMAPFHLAKTQKRNQTKIIESIYQEQKARQQYKITNKRTISILKKNNLTPIHKRTEQILSKKKFNIELMHQEKMEQEMETMQPEIQPEEQYFIDQRKMYKKQLDSFRKGVDEKNHSRLKKKHIKELLKIDNREVFYPVPKIAKSSKSLSKMHFMKKKLSTDVFERLGQERVDRQKRQKMYKEQRVEEQGGFRPILNDNSRIIASQSKSKKSFGSINQSQCHKKCKERKVFSPFWVRKNQHKWERSPYSNRSKVDGRLKKSEQSHINRNRSPKMNQKVNRSYHQHNLRNTDEKSKPAFPSKNNLDKRTNQKPHSKRKVDKSPNEKRKIPALTDRRQKSATSVKPSSNRLRIKTQFQ